MDLKRGERLAQYELVEKVGEGGMGVVWKAHDTRLDRIVALKLLREDCCADTARLARFDHEARALAAVRHPGIVTIYSIEQAGDHRFLTMEHVAGRTLAQTVPDGGLTLGEFFDLAEPLAEAVRAAHAQGVMHRDLKPANVLVTDSGEIKVLDFGIAAFRTPRAAIAAADASTSVNTTVGDLVGTPPYMAPEQLLGREPDTRADVFSLGATLYFMLTGREPFTADTSAAIMAAVLRDAPTPLATLRPELPQPLADAIERCLAKQPEARFQDVAQLVDALRSVRVSDSGVDSRPVRSIAVLPFDDLSPEKDQEYFCEGIAEEIILSLSRIKGMRVASRAAAFLARRDIRDRRELASQLGVEAVLEGSVRKAGSHLRITVGLTDVASQYQLWAERYDRELQDIFAIQDDIAARVADALCCTLTQIERRALRQRPTPQVHAYDFYLRGRKFLYQYSRKGADFASRMFSRALELEPTYARAYAGLAECHAYLYLYAGRHATDLDRADAHSLRALELAPESAEAHSARGIALSLVSKYEEAAAEFDAAIRLNPELFDAHYFYARVAFATGHYDDAIRLWERASAIRPEEYQSPLLVAQAYEQLGRTSEAEASRRRGVAVGEEHLKLFLDDVRAIYMVANGLVALGRHEEGLDRARQALALEPEEPMLLYNIGCIYALAGRLDAALDCLERSIANGMTQKEWPEHDPNWDPLRADPRFIRLMASFDAPART